MRHLEGAEHIAVRKPNERMRVREPIHIAELCGNARRIGHGKVKDPRLPTRKPIGKELPVRRELVLRVVRSVAAARHGECCNQSPVARRVVRGLRDIKHREKVRLRRVGGRRPEVEVVPRRGLVVTTAECHKKRQRGE